MLKSILLYLIPYRDHYDLIINYSRIYSKAARVKPVNHKNPISKVEDLRTVNVKIRRFVVMGFEWCEENIGRRNDDYTLKINYTYSRTHGTYLYYDKLIIIRVWDSLKLIDLVEVIVHEYIHYLQFKTYRHKLKSDHLEEKHGYQNNPYEIEARMISSKLKNPCFSFLMAKIAVN